MSIRAASGKRPNYGVDQVGEGELVHLDPLVARPKHLIQVLLLQASPVHRQEADQTNERNL